MPRGGYRPGAGRKSKDETKATKAIAKEVTTANVRRLGYKTPLEYMMDVINDAEADAKRRDSMAVMAAPYVHAKADAVAGAKGKKEQAQEAAQEAASGKFAPPKPPRLVVNNE